MSYSKAPTIKSEFVKKLSVLFKKLKWRYWLTLTILFAIPSFFSLLRPGFFSMQDDLQAFRIFEMDKCFSDFQIPCRWVPDAGYGYGYPQFNYYAPFVYYLGEIIHLVGFQFIDVVKILFVLGFLAGAVGMYALVSSFTGPFTGFVVATLFTYAPFRAQEVYVRGALSEFWVISIFPFVLFLIYKILKKPSLKNVGFFGLSLGILLTTHNLLPYIFAPVAILWTFFWMWKEKKFEALPKIILGSLLGIGLSSFFLLPMIFERGFIHIDSVLSGYFDYRRHFVSISQIFLSNTFGYGSSDLGEADDLALSTGFILLYTAIASIPLALINFKREKKYSQLSFLLVGILLASLFLMHLRSSFLWEAIPFFKWLQFPWRFLAVSTLVSAITAGITLKFLGFFRFGIGLILIVSVFIFHGSFFQPKDWFLQTDEQKFSGESWERQLTISIFDYLPVSSELPPKNKAKDLPEILGGAVEILNFERGSNFQKMSVSAESNSKIRMQMYDFPGMLVKIDNARVTHYHDCSGQDPCLGLITFDLRGGKHNVLVKLGNTPIRILSNLLTLFASVLITLFLTKKNYGQAS